MKIKKIISTVLTAVMIFTALIAAVPMTASAAYSESSATSNLKVPEGVTEANLDSDAIDKYIKEEFLNYNFDTAEEMLNHELSKGYLYYVDSPGKLYTIYINKYTGFVFYVNNYTGQILTSNPINPGYGNLGQENQLAIMSQLRVSLIEIGNDSIRPNYNSMKWAALRSQISIDAIKGGYRVNYALGDTTTRFLLPGIITADAYETNILKPIVLGFQQLLEETCGTVEGYEDYNFSFFENENFVSYYDYGGINTSSQKKDKGLRYYLEQMQIVYGDIYDSNTVEYKQLDAYRIDIRRLIGSYSLYAPQKYIGDSQGESSLTNDKGTGMYDKYPVTKPVEDGGKGVAIYVCNIKDDIAATKRPIANIIKKYCPDYTLSMMVQHETECDYKDNSEPQPVVRCSIEYSFNDDGSLSVRLPANSIIFDESKYYFDSLVALEYFGCGDMENAGYMLYPDGSGAIIEFEDFYNEAAGKIFPVHFSSTIYGNDYAYSKITGAHKEQLTMPVYGVVNDVKTNALTSALTEKEKVTNGYFAIIEEGETLTSLGFYTGGDQHRYGGVYTVYNHLPGESPVSVGTDISVGSVGTNKIVNTRYTGSFVTRYVMLTDEAVGESVYGSNAYYKSNYSGMAAYYRDYLEGNGVLEALEVLSEDIPLYIEVLGAMNIKDRFLSFPITKSIPLTTFDNVLTMYKELAQCEELIVSKIQAFEELLENENDEAQRYHYKQLIDRYSALIGNIENIGNINFKLTGFANGGMASTYPVKLKWAKACGGKSGFKALVKEANTVSETAGINFGVYPEFDFMYINNTSMFDGISNRGNVSKLVDNRYASKQVYNAVSREYESFYTMVINPDALDNLYGKFSKKYSKYEIKGISASTLGSDLNSNFNEKAPVDREIAKENVSALLDRIANDNGYDVMLDKGNIYAVEYATHMLNVAIDSSHLRYASYTVPFTGLILHSYVNYTGTPINFSGSADYDLLRSIENGASLYYILAYQNTSYLKDDKNLSKYFGVDYNNWYDSILKTYNKLNGAIGDLQQHKIVDHKVLIAERIIESGEAAANNVLLKIEALKLLDKQLLDAVNNAYITLSANPENASKWLKVDVTEADRAALMNQFSDCLNISLAELEASDFDEELDKIIAKYEAEYVGAADEANTYTINFGSVNYKTEYKYVTDSCATDMDYIYTDYTNDNGNVAMVTYQKGDNVVKFILNYNNYPVAVRLDANTLIEIAAYDYTRIEEVK